MALAQRTNARTFLFLLFGTVLSFARVNAYTYDEEAAIRHVHLAGAAYCSPSSISSWDVGPHAVKDFTPTHTWSNATLQYYVGYDTKERSIVASVRGSVSFSNWIDNIDALKTYPFKSYGDGDIGIHGGFWTEYNIMRQSLIENIKDAMKISGYNKITPTGHSSGASNVLLLSYEIAAYNIIPDLELKEVFTYGLPRVGNKAFANAFESVVGKHTRVTHYHDIVPHVPEEWMGFYHTNTEVYYDEPSENYKVCEENEDSTCSNSCGPISCVSVDDHMTYIQIPIGSAGCGSTGMEIEEGWDIGKHGP